VLPHRNVFGTQRLSLAQFQYETMLFDNTRKYPANVQAYNIKYKKFTPPSLGGF